MQPLSPLPWGLTLSDLMLLAGGLIGIGRVLGVQAVYLKSITNLEKSIAHLSESIDDVRRNLGLPPYLPPADE